MSLNLRDSKYFIAGKNCPWIHKVLLYLSGKCVIVREANCCRALQNLSQQLCCYVSSVTSYFNDLFAKSDSYLQKCFDSLICKIR